MTTPAAALVALLSAALPPPPETPKRPVADEYHGVKVADPYRWLEDSASGEVRAWSEAQNRRSRAFLDALPHLAEIRTRVTELVKSASVRYYGLVDRPGALFALKWDPAKQQPALVALRSADDLRSERVIVDPSRMDPSGKTTLDWFVPTLDGSRVAVSISRGGTEQGNLHFFDAATGAEIGETIARVHGGTAGGSAAWNADGTGLFYTRYPRPGERPPADENFFQQVYFHRLGTPVEKDSYELGKELPRIAEIVLATKRDGRFVLAEVKNGDGGESAFWIRPTAGGGWSQVSRFEDRVIRAELGADDALYLVSRKAAPRGQVLRLPLETPTLDRARVLVPEGDGAIERLTPTRSRLYVVDVVGGPSRLRAIDLSGRPLAPVPLPDVASVNGVVRAGDDGVLFEVETFLAPAAWYRLDAGSGKATRTALHQTSIADFSDAEVVRDFAASKDGTKVPLDVIRRKGTKLDGDNPTLLYAYGGYGISQTPSFSALRRAWLDQGGVWVVANIRGGGEYGDAWHYGGNLTKKQNGFDDFYACARWLVSKGYTKPSRLAILGGSNGGLLMGAALTQHPEAYRAVVSFVGIYDMLRVETTPNGAFNVTEFGSVKDKRQFEALYGYSPYHRVADGAKYPSILLISGENDPRVDPWHSRKFTARLQAENASPNPILLRTSSTGHGIGTALDELIAWRVDQLAFLFHELDVRWRPPPRAREAR